MFRLSDETCGKFSDYPMVFPYQPASLSEIQKYCLSHHLLSSVSFIAEVTSCVEADNWSGKFFSQTQQQPSKVCSNSEL